LKPWKKKDFNKKKRSGSIKGEGELRDLDKLIRARLANKYLQLVEKGVGNWG